MEGNSDMRKTHLMKWSDVVKPRGRSGQWKDDATDAALLSRWPRRFGKERKVLWRKGISLNYGEGEG